MTEEIKPHLYLVPTPIGNLQDITLRAIDVLQRVDVILAEDTRTTGKLLKHLEIQRPLQSYHIFNEHKTVEKLVARMEAGEQFALVSDAGTPAISDPGFLLVRAVREAGLEVNCLPGATAFVPALVNSALPNDRFVFEGFLPHKKGRKTRIENLLEEQRTMIFYESPHRLLKTLTQLMEAFGGDRMACVSRELTKMYEENIRGTLEELIDYYNENTIKGEIVITVAGKN
ncbi:16S rRNA (cytidine(1402)-2'-O)-methyltransferase [Echinicola vietnamensis]|uniref:Ribosomal RNA small subunit methyltransferase I n=1 Tax=Echinicola vietnamensis (strain DSM 17526 / LMG 23754 / KMM 6221) TaxID=926556 RepID=L0FV00_ECHVK|nr:16S rRNA (cytidine(1402)-2'-O)-methyltransferase [Echinicola vietnamensis]AGA77122.1 putative S-adenosylmethionine-dependent methyltransferase, YraL family [Echinicola vietnamensis DSM 17526]